MKQKRKSMFWGLFFVALGVLLLLNYVFGFHLPVFRVLFALFIIYIGVSMLFGSFGVSWSGEKRSTDHEAVFARSTFKYPPSGPTDNDGYVTAFGSSTLDLTNVDPSTNPIIKVTVAFGEARILVKKGTPLKVKSTTAFGKSDLPEKNVNAFGEFLYRSEGLKESDAAISVHATVAFGQLKVEELP